MTSLSSYGFGDSQTWPACVGHANDPRTDNEDHILAVDDLLTTTHSPYIGWNLIEALNEADMSKLDAIGKALESGDFLEAGALLNGLTSGYWEKRAEEDAK